MRQIVTLSMNEKMLQQIDKKRGLIPRSAFIKKLILPTLEMAIENELSIEEYFEIMDEVIEETKVKLAKRKKGIGADNTNKLTTYSKRGQKQ